MAKAKKKSKSRRSKRTSTMPTVQKSARGRLPKAIRPRLPKVAWDDRETLKNAAAAVLGGAGGAMLGGILVRHGIRPATAAVGVTVAGSVAAMTLDGAPRLAAGGAAAAGAGQLALSWLATQPSINHEQPSAPQLPAALPAPQALPKRQGRPSVESSFDRARKEVGVRNEFVHDEDYEVYERNN